MPPDPPRRLVRSTPVLRPAWTLLAAAAVACEPTPSGPTLGPPESNPPPRALWMEWSETRPRVVVPGRDRTVEVRARFTVPPSRVELVEPIGGDVHSLRPSGDGRVWRVELDVDAALSRYGTGDLRTLIGHLDVYDGSERVLRSKTHLLVNDATVPEVIPVRLGEAAQRGRYVLNLREDSLFAWGSVRDRAVRRFYDHFPDDIDFLALVGSAREVRNRSWAPLRNDVEGLGLPTWESDVEELGGPERLQGLIHYPIDALFDLAGTASVHEIGHRWMVHFTDSILGGRNHWPPSSLAYSAMGWSRPNGQGLQFPFRLEPLPDGRVRLECTSPAVDYNDMELYLMGLLPVDSVGTHTLLTDPVEPACGVTSRVEEFDVAAWVLERYGPRAPAWPDAQRRFRMATVVLSRGRLLAPAELAWFDHMAARGEADRPLPSRFDGLDLPTHPFAVATGHRASLETRLSTR